MKIRYFMKSKKSLLFTALAIAGFAGTTYLTARATAKAVKKIEAKEEELGRELEPMEKVKEVAVDYAAPVAAGVVTIIGITGMEKTAKAKIAGLTASYAGLRSQYDRFKKEAENKLGSEKVNEIIDKIETKTKIPKRKAPVGTDKERICMELPTGDIWFEASLVDVMNGKYLINDKFWKNGYVAMDEVCQIYPVDIDASKHPELVETGWDWGAGESWFGYDTVDFDLIERNKDSDDRYYVMRFVYSPHPLFDDYDALYVQKYLENNNKSEE